MGEAQTTSSQDGGGGGGGARTGKTGLFALFVGPGEEGGDELEDLEFFGVGAVEGEEVEEVVCYDLSGWVYVGLGEEG